MEQPAADLTIVVPVAVAIMTPFPLLAIYIVQKIRACFKTDQMVLLDEDKTPPTESMNEDVEHQNEGQYVK